jgi:hypothetical protein
MQDSPEGGGGTVIGVIAAVAAVVAVLAAMISWSGRFERHLTARPNTAPLALAAPAPRVQG